MGVTDVTTEKPPVKPKKINDLNLLVKTRRELDYLENNLRKLVSWTEYAMVSLKTKKGSQSYNWLVDELAAHGLKLNMSPQEIEEYFPD